MTPHPALQVLGELDLLTVLLYGECRGEPTMAQIAVGFTVRNRVDSGKWFGGPYKAVILRWAQYSCLWPTHGGANFESVIQCARDLRDAEHTRLLTHLGNVATLVMDAPKDDLTGGATHYYDDSIAPPAWTKSPARETLVIGRLHFWANVA